MVYAHPNDHVGYYPGASTLYLKLLFDRSCGRVLDAQGVGRSGVERCIDVIAVAIQMKATVFDLEEAELCYAPQFGAAKDPVNMLGMIAANVMRGDLVITPWSEMGKDNAVVLDVRDAYELEREPGPGELHIPLNELRSRLDELPRERPIQIICAVAPPRLQRHAPVAAARVSRQPAIRRRRDLVLREGCLTSKRYGHCP